MTKSFFGHLRVYIFRGLLAIIPLLLCLIAVQLLYVLIDRKIMGFLENFIQIRQIPGLGIVLLLLTLYLLGLAVSNFLGHQFFRLLDSVSQRIPLIKTIYGIGKQLSQSFSTLEQEKKAFKKAVLVKLSDGGLAVPGFIMSSLVDRTTQDEYMFVLVPTAPTPGSGFVVVVKASQIIDPGWTVEECLKAIVSVGIVTPKEMR